MPLLLLLLLIFIAVFVAAAAAAAAASTAVVDYVFVVLFFLSLLIILGNSQDGIMSIPRKKPFKYKSTTVSSVETGSVCFVFSSGYRDQKEI